MDYRYTRIWRVEHKLVIANTIEEAIKVYKTYVESVGNIIPTDITTIKAIGDNQIPEDFDALIRPQNTWKPSDEQLVALEDVIENNIYHPLLEELLEQLKKLREE